MNAASPRFEGRWPTFVALLNDRADRHPTQRVLGFLSDGEQSESWRTFRELDAEARAIAARLQSLGRQSQPALLLYWPGLEFVSAFLGCLYAGVVAVPVYLPRPGRPFARLEAIAADAGTEIALTTGALLPELSSRLQGHSQLGSLCWLVTDHVDRALAETWQAPAIDADSLACLQYTSGSTAAPKGVMLTHRNLLSNSALIYEAFEHGPDSVGVIWLPPYHDMGLIGGILQPLYGGFPTALMSPTHVVQQPLRWLAAISRFRATTSGGPNFIYDLCVDRIADEERASLDLSSWQVAFNGAEPVRAETLDRFAAKFAPCGFRRKAFFPCYGLAEATLFVSGGPKGEPPVTRIVSKSGLENHRVLPPKDAAEDLLRVVGCGAPASELEVAIVDPESSALCGEGRVGEIWVSGAGVAGGYWHPTDETEKTFDARLSDAGPRPYLRTGDLGFLCEGQLFVAGRRKDLLIIDGRNHYPQDIELTVERCHPALRSHSGAAFSIDDCGEKLVVVHEVERNGRKAPLAEIIAAIQEAVSEQHELAVHAIALVKVGGVAKTPSGKIRRRDCREMFLRGQLPLVAEWREPDARPRDVMSAAGEQRRTSFPGRPIASGEGGFHEVVPPKGDPPPPLSTADPSPGRTSPQSEQSIRQWLMDRVALQIQSDPGVLDARQPLARYGLKSRDAMAITGELERWLDRRLSPTLVYEHPSIESLARHLAGQTRPQQGNGSTVRGRAGAVEAVAMVGLACRFPGAPNVEAFWNVLAEGRDAISEVPPERWNASHAPGSVRWGGWLEEIDRFDPGFFGISPREAASMDPQHRLLMEVAWEALEDAGQPADGLRGSGTGVFIGISTNDYCHHVFPHATELDPYWTTGNASSIAANRLSYCFDFRGPSLAIDTACSSSLVAVHLACESLRAGDCEVALAGGVNVILSPNIALSFIKGGGLAPDGRCKAFDARANGIVRSEGVGVVVLKPLSRALADGDRVYAVIRGGAVNQDGRSNGITAPSQAAQEALLRDAWCRAGVLPADIQYVETHGAGTLLGDVIEANALSRVFADSRPRTSRCAIGSVKTNIGHCEAAAGMAGLIKVALAIDRGQIPPNLHFLSPNPHIHFEEMPLFVPTELGPWPEDGTRRVAGVSSFGFGGTNAHLVVESPPHEAQAAKPSLQSVPAVHVLPLTAATRPALAALAARWEDFLTRDNLSLPDDLADLCASATRRSHLDHRAVVRFRTREDLSQRLALLRAGKGHTDVVEGKVSDRIQPRIVFVFSGHGGQWRGMHRPLADAFPVFREKIEECDALLRDLAGWSVASELNADAPDSRVEDGSIEIAQSLLFAFQVGLAAAWKSWGIEPDAVVGHSVGEIAAAHVAGALELPDAARIIVHRSRLLQQALDEFDDVGAMAAIRVSADQAEALIRGFEDRLWIAVHNSPSYTVVSGDREALEGLVARLRKQKIAGRVMNVPGAAHTPRLEPTRFKLQAALEGLHPQTARIPFFSTVTGRQHDGQDLNAEYWGDNVRQTVRFAPAIDRLGEEHFRLFLELGPHPLLTAAITQCMEHRRTEAVVLPSLRRDDQDLASMLGSFGALFAHGVDVDWRVLYPGRRRWVAIPSYPWQRERYWAEFAPHAPPVAPTEGQRPAEVDDRAIQPLAAPASSDGGSQGGLSPATPVESRASVPAALVQAVLDASPGEKAEKLQAYLRSHVACALATDPARIDVEQPVTTLGVDSLMAMEIKNRVESELRIELPIVQLLEGPSIASLAELLLARLAAPAQPAEDRPILQRAEEDQGLRRIADVEMSEAEATRLLEQLDDISDEDVDALIQRVMDHPRGPHEHKPGYSPTHEE